MALGKHVFFFNKQDMKQIKHRNIHSTLSNALKERVRDDIRLMEISEVSDKEQLMSYARWMADTYNISIPSALLQMKKSLKLHRVKDIWFNSQNEIIYTETELTL